MSVTDRTTTSSALTGPAGASAASDQREQDERGPAARGLAVRDVVVRYDDGDTGPTTAVDGVSLDVAPGEVVALLGPSGCGKSSLLRAVAGLEPPVAGSIRWDGADLAGVPVHRRGFGLMFQEGQLFPHRDVARNVAFGLEMAGAGRRDRARRVEELLRTVGLEGYGRRAVSTLSGGEQQRVALARALAPTPQLLLLDEPLSALDRSLRERLAADVRRTLVETGTTALFVTHDHDEAFTVADRVAVMSAGRLLRVDTPARLWREPGSREVAEFLGYEAFVPLGGAAGVAAVAAHVRRALGERARTAGAAVAALARGALVVDPAGGGPTTGAAVAGGETRTAGPGMAAGMTGTTGTATFRHGRSEVAVDVPGLGAVTAVAPGATVLEPGTTVTLRVDPAYVAVVPG